MVASSFCHDRKSVLRLQLHGAIYSPDSFVFILRYCANSKAVRYESTTLNGIVADKSHHVIVALVSCQTVKNFSWFCLDVESLVAYSNNKKADF